MKRKRNPKVWGGLTFQRIPDGHRQVRTVVAASSQKEAAALVGVSMYEFRHYWCETRNDVEVRAALSAVGTVFVATTDRRFYEPVRG